jgi:Cu-Zn family superoxide dismutase
MRIAVAAVALLLAIGPAQGEATRVTSRSVPIYAVDARGIGARLGTVEMKDVPDGLRIKLELEGLPPGPHGFHVHTVSDCSQAEIGGRIVPAGAAGPPYDPFRTGRHAGPHGNGYLGDLPFIAVAKDGRAKYTMTAPRLKVDDLRNRSVLITAGGDNYTDTPPMGGGGDAIACGTIR